METKTIVIALAQLNRQLQNTASRVPDISHLRDSGQIEQDANMIILLSQNGDEKHQVNLEVAKNRSGAVGKMSLDFIPECTLFKAGGIWAESRVMREASDDFASQLEGF